MAAHFRGKRLLLAGLGPPDSSCHHPAEIGKKSKVRQWFHLFPGRYSRCGLCAGDTRVQRNSFKMRWLYLRETVNIASSCKRLQLLAKIISLDRVQTWSRVVLGTPPAQVERP